MKKEDFTKAQGHWILARMGKRVLRPGGKELTLRLMKELQITNMDNIMEFAPGRGFTASLTISKNPESYIGIDANEDSIAYLKRNFKGEHIKFIHGNAAHTPVSPESIDKLYGEAMLTMHADHRKSEIIKEAHRILKKGGLYGIHELGLHPNGINEHLKTEIQKELALAIKVNARPLTISEWKDLLENEGFRIKTVATNAMHLLEPGRIINDEGFIRTLKIGWNIVTHPDARKRILQMRKTFKKYQDHINAVAIVAEKT